jgi:hypothetical protein
MPSTRKRIVRGQSRFNVSSEVIRAIQEGDMMRGRDLLGLKPWEWGFGFEFLMIPEGPEFDDLIKDITERLRDAS